MKNLSKCELPWIYELQRFSKKFSKYHENFCVEIRTQGQDDPCKIDFSYIIKTNKADRANILRSKTFPKTNDDFAVSEFQLLLRKNKMLDSEKSDFTKLMLNIFLVYNN